jgi:hydrogenase nickel incorporation protein HypA/HybF
MHEYSIMSQVVQTILEEVEKNNLKAVSRVTLEIGELSFLGEEALMFCYGVLSKDNILSNSELIIEKINTEIECQSCGYSGNLDFIKNEEFHYRLPTFSCPKCDGKVKIIKGKGCVLKEITGET